MSKSEVFNLDCMEGMKRYPDKYFDLAVVDPPYFTGPEKRGYYGSKVSKIGVHRDYPVSPKWKVPDSDYFEELIRVSKKYIVWGCNYYKFVFSPGRIVWDKCNQGSDFSNCEIAATNLFDSVRLFRFMWNGMMQGKSISEGWIQQGNKAKNEERIHPTQKPVALYAWIFQNYAKPGDKILDTHLGSGSSRIAAYEQDLNFVGFELDKHYFDAQEERFQNHIAQLSFFSYVRGGKAMTTDQRAALEILLDAQNALDTDTQLMPLIRFVLFGTTGTVESEPEQEEQTADVILRQLDGDIVAQCGKCGAVFASCREEETAFISAVYRTAQDARFCPHCHAKFK